MPTQHLTLVKPETHTHRIQPLGVGLLAVGVGLFIFGIYVARYTGGGLLSIAILFPGLFLAMYEAGLERGGHQKLWRTRATRYAGSVEDSETNTKFETEVMNNTIDLADRLGLRKFRIRRVAWSPPQDQTRNVASRECHFDRDDLVLSSRLRNVLTPDEWTPLVAVSLIYDKKLMPRVFRTRQTAFLIPWILGLAGLGVLMSYPGNSIFALPFILWLFLPLFVAIRLWGNGDRKRRLLANSEAGDLVGRERLAASLVKVSDAVPEPVYVDPGTDELPTTSDRLNRLEPAGTGYQDANVRRVKESLQRQKTELQKRSRATLWRRHRRFFFTFIIIMIIVVPVTAFLVWDNSVCPPATIIPAGTQILVGPSRHSDYGFNVPNVVWNSRSIWGTFTATHAVAMFVMTAQQFNSFNSTGTPGPSLFDSGQVTSASYECSGTTCPPAPFAHLGQEYVVFYNPNASIPATVTIGQAIYLGGC